MKYYKNINDLVTVDAQGNATNYIGAFLPGNKNIAGIPCEVNQGNNHNFIDLETKDETLSNGEKASYDFPALMKIARSLVGEPQEKKVAAKKVAAKKVAAKKVAAPRKR